MNEKFLIVSKSAGVSVVALAAGEESALRLATRSRRRWCSGRRAVLKATRRSKSATARHRFEFAGFSLSRSGWDKCTGGRVWTVWTLDFVCRCDRLSRCRRSGCQLVGHLLSKCTIHTSSCSASVYTAIFAAIATVLETLTALAVAALWKPKLSSMCR